MQNPQTLVCPHRIGTAVYGYVTNEADKDASMLSCSSRYAQAHNVHTHVHTLTNTRTHKHTHTRTHNTHTRTHVHTHGRTHARTHTHIHIHTHAGISLGSQPGSPDFASRAKGTAIKESGENTELMVAMCVSFCLQCAFHFVCNVRFILFEMCVSFFVCAGSTLGGLCYNSLYKPTIGYFQHLAVL